MLYMTIRNKMMVAHGGFKGNSTSKENSKNREFLTFSRKDDSVPKPWENTSGCKDPTAYAATKPIEEEEQRISDLVKAIRTFARLAGFDFLNRIEFRDRRSGRTYR